LASSKKDHNKSPSGAEKFQSPSENLYPNGHTLGIVLLLLQPSLCTAELNKKVEVAGSIFPILRTKQFSKFTPENRGGFFFYNKFYDFFRVFWKHRFWNRKSSPIVRDRNFQKLTSVRL